MKNDDKYWEYASPNIRFPRKTPQALSPSQHEERNMARHISIKKMLDFEDRLPLHLDDSYARSVLKNTDWDPDIDPSCCADDWNYVDVDREPVFKERENMTKEDKLKYHIWHIMKVDFEILHEIRGTHRLTGKPIQIDYLARARNPFLVNSGFPGDDATNGECQEDCWFGIEAKNIDNEDPRTKAGNTVQQCIDYMHSEFKLPNGLLVRPFMVLACVSGTNSDSIDQPLKMGAKSVVGRLFVNHEDGPKFLQPWIMYFGKKYSEAGYGLFETRPKNLPKIKVGSR